MKLITPIGESIKTEKDIWQTPIMPLNQGISKLSEEGKKLGLVLSIAVGDRWIYTNKKPK